MNRPKHICIAILDDPLYKQSSIRVAKSLSKAGYKVTLIGRRLKKDTSATNEEGKEKEEKAEEGKTPYQFKRKRFNCFFQKGKLSYLEMNLRIFWHLLANRTDLVCAVNLDTILPCWAVSKLKGIPRVYDARELFTELKEVVTRPKIQRAWLWVERTMVPRFPHGYAVSQGIADELHKRYGVEYAVIRNMTELKDFNPGPRPLPYPYLLYQGAVNYGRGLDELIPAMKHIDLPLVICGTGNYLEQTKALVEKNGLKEKVILTGQLSPDDLKDYTYYAFVGMNLVEKEGLNQYYSLPNKLFDYIHAGIPQVTMDYPEYRRIQEQFEIAVLIKDVSEAEIIKAIHQLTTDHALYDRLKKNCIPAKLVFNWQAEEHSLVKVFKDTLSF